MNSKYSFRAIIAYDGTHYFGWQATRMGPSIQEQLTLALYKASQEKAVPEAASRTDRGVHAEGQSIAFSLQKEWDPCRLLRAMNAHLPPDIRIKSMQTTSSDFHPTLQAQEKIYHYRISTDLFQIPMDRLYAWHFPYALDLGLMEQAALKLLGQHDFSAFSTQRAKDPICTLSSITFDHLSQQKLQITLQGNRFLYKMARTLAGTLLYIGSGKLNYDCIPPPFLL